jgi:hypothetical protein
MTSLHAKPERPAIRLLDENTSPYFAQLQTEWDVSQIQAKLDDNDFGPVVVRLPQFSPSVLRASQERHDIFYQAAIGAHQPRSLMVSPENIEQEFIDPSNFSLMSFVYSARHHFCAYKFPFEKTGFQTDARSLERFIGSDIVQIAHILSRDFDVFDPIVFRLYAEKRLCGINAWHVDSSILVPRFIENLRWLNTLESGFLDTHRMTRCSSPYSAVYSREMGTSFSNRLFVRENEIVKWAVDRRSATAEWAVDYHILGKHSLKDFVFAQGGDLTILRRTANRNVQADLHRPPCSQEIEAQQGLGARRYVWCANSWQRPPAV